AVGGNGLLEELFSFVAGGANTLLAQRAAEAVLRAGPREWVGLAMHDLERIAVQLDGLLQLAIAFRGVDRSAAHHELFRELNARLAPRAPVLHRGPEKRLRLVQMSALIEQRRGQHLLANELAERLLLRLAKALELRDLRFARGVLRLQK